MKTTRSTRLAGGTMTPNRLADPRARTRGGLARASLLAALLGAWLSLGHSPEANAQNPDGMIDVNSSMVSGNFQFIYSGTINTFGDPIPYGFTNNIVDSGWIWVNGSELDVDMGSPTVVSKFRVWCCYPGQSSGSDTGARGAQWAIEYSDDQALWSQATLFNYTTGLGLGLNDDGSYRSDTAGWYECAFNSAGEAHRYWRVRMVAVSLIHCPRSASVQFIGPSSLPFVFSTSPTGNTVRANAPISLEIQDGTTALAPETVRLFLNGAAVTPSLSKPAGSKTTTVTYTAPGGLPASTNIVTCVFGNAATPSVLQTNQFSFVVMNDNASALVINIDFKGIRYDGSISQPAYPTFVGQGSADGGTVWNGLLADSRVAGGSDNNDSLTLSATNLANSLGDPTSVAFALSGVGGESAGTYTTNAADGNALLGDYVFDNMYANMAGVSPFTISGLGDVPTVNLYFYLSSGTVTIPGSSSSPFAGPGIYVWPNTVLPLFFQNVPVTGGQVTGYLGKGTTRLGGLTVQKPAQRPFVATVSPTGTVQQSSPTILVRLQDYVTQVASGLIQLLVDGQLVTPAITKTGGQTTVTYTPAAPLSATNHTVRVIFGDTSTPAVMQTNDFNFVVAPQGVLNVTANMLCGSASFLATPAAYSNLADPVPFGAANNVSDAGWIWKDGSWFTVDFGARAAVTQVRAWCSYAGTPTDDGARGAVWMIGYGDDTNAMNSVFEFDYQTGPGLGVNDDGGSRQDAAGWYGTSFNTDFSASSRFWQVSEMGALLKHSPRTATVQFYGKLITPSILAASPTGSGHAKTAVIEVLLQDHETQVAPASIQMTLNGVTVAAVVTKPAGTNVTTLTYDAKGALPVGVNTVNLSFGDSSSPSYVAYGSFTFVVESEDYLDVTADMIGASTTFLATPSSTTVANPIPYGFANNTSDAGWIWLNNSFMIVDFGVPTILNKIRLWSVYPTAPYAAVWRIEYSNDNVTFTQSEDYTFETSVGGGLNDDGTARTDCAGWYLKTFNSAGASARYWRIRQISTTDHAPRCGQMQFFGKQLAARITLNYARQANSLVLSWSGSATLESAASLNGPWTDVATTSPQTVSLSASQKFYRLRQ